MNKPLNQISKEEANKKPIRWFIKWYGNNRTATTFKEEYKRHCLYDSSVGIHYNLRERFDECKNREDIKKKIDNGEGGSGPRSYILCNQFINEVDNGDWVYLGYGSTVTHLAQIDSDCYFSNDPKFCDPSGPDKQIGYFHRRKLKNVMEIPEGSKIVGPFMKGIEGPSSFSVQ